MPLIFMSAGELSGDAHGAKLAKALIQAIPNVKLVGFGGPKMKAAGVDILYDMTHTSIVGLVEAIRYIPEYKRAIQKIVQDIKRLKPDVFIPIDNQGFHMMVLNKIKEEPCKKIYYIAPQEWQWGTEKAGKKVIALVDCILSIFPEEAQFYKRLGGNVCFVGHPIVDLVEDTIDSEKELLITVFPGSRRQEISRMGPILLQAASLFQKKHPSYAVEVSLSDERYRSDIERMIDHTDLSHVDLSTESSSQLINRSKASLSTSGTITFEHACLLTPCVVAYKFHPMTYFLAKTLFKKMTDRITYMSLPNILLGKECFPEFLQSKATPDALYHALEAIVYDDLRYSSIQKDCKLLKSKLGEKGVVDRAATHIKSFLST